MSQASAYERTKNFQENAPNATDHAAINREFDAVALSIRGLRENQSGILNDDGTIKNGTVGLDQITDEAKAELRAQVGPEGPQGPQGETGPQGPQGAKGDVGASFVPNASGTFEERAVYDDSPKGLSFLVLETGMLYWKLSSDSGDWSSGVQFGKGEKGDQGEQGPVGPRGLRGYTGETGPQGPAGEDGADGVVTEIDVDRKSVGLVGKTTLMARLTLTNGKLSIVLEAV